MSDPHAPGDAVDAGSTIVSRVRGSAPTPEADLSEDEGEPTQALSAHVAADRVEPAPTRRDRAARAPEVGDVQRPPVDATGSSASVAETAPSVQAAPSGQGDTAARGVSTGLGARAAYVPVVGGVDHGVPAAEMPVWATRSESGPREPQPVPDFAAIQAAVRADARRRRAGILLVSAGIVLIAGSTLVLLLTG